MGAIDLLRSIFETLVFAPKTSPVAFVPHSPEAALQMPRNLFPENCLIEQLPASEGYLEAMRDAIERLQPRDLLIWPVMALPRLLPDTLQRRYPRLDLSEITLLQALEVLPIGARLGIVLPYSVFGSTKMPELRRRIGEHAAIQFVVAHDGSLQEPNLHMPSAVRFGTLVLSVGVVQQEIRFFKHPTVAEDAEAQAIVNDLRRLKKQGGGTTRYGYVVRDPLPADSPLLFERHHPELHRRERDMAVYGGVQPLGKLVQLRRGAFHSARDSHHFLLAEKADNPGAHLLEGRSILQSGEITLEVVRYRVLAEPERLLQPGDLICRRIIAPNATRLPVARYTEQLGPATTAENLLVIRPPKEMTQEDQDILLAYLRSEKAFQSLQARGQSVQLRLDLLADLPVPVFDQSLRLAYRSLMEAAAQFTEWQAEAERARNQLFIEASVKEERFQLLSLGRRARQRREAGLLVDDFRHRLRTQYPHPIAYRWRLVETAKPDLEGYIHVLESAEATVCYLAAMAMVIARTLQKQLSSVAVIADQVSGSSSRGTTMGNWVAILQEASSAIQESSTDVAIPFRELGAILKQPETQRAIDRLKEQRNDQAHGKGPKGEEIPAAFEEAINELEALLRTVEFLAEYPLRYIESTRRDSLAGRTYYEYRELMGDHPLVPQKRGIAGSSELEAQSLYIVGRDGTPHLLRPLLTRRTCPGCGQEATFYLDSYDPKTSQCSLKALEHSHPRHKGIVADAEITDAFQHIGLVK